MLLVGSHVVVTELTVTPGAPLQPVAIVVGPAASGSRLVVVTLANPRAPTVVGWLDVPSGVDGRGSMLVREGIAYIGGTSGTTLVSVSAPASPRYAGVVTGVGGRLSLSADGAILYGQGTLFGSGATVGLHAAALERVAVLRAAPTLTRLQPATPMPAPGTGTRETALALDLAVQIYPTPMTDLAVGVTLEVDGRGAQTLPAAPDAAVAGQYRVVLPTGALTYPEGTRVWGSAHVVASDGGVVSTPRRQLPLVEATVLVDSTNNTTVDVEDDAAKRRGDAWAFWEADPAQMDVDGAPTEKGLTDFATVRLEVNQAVSGLALRLRSPDPERAGATRWSLTEKVAIPEEAAGLPKTLQYLWGEHSSGAQRLAASQPCLTANGRLRGRCRPSGLLSDSIALPTNLSAGTHEFLLRCENCPVGEEPPGQAVSTRQLEVVYTPATTGAVPIVADAAPVDIRPLPQWMSMLTARRGSKLDKVNGELVEVQGWRAVSDDPDVVTTVLVHGYGVDDASAVGSYSTVFRHLYWSGLPVLDSRRRQVVGVLWPGNAGVTGVTYFPGDEFNAFQTGVPLGRFLETRKGKGQVLQILAHSLGNLAVNSAILRAPSMAADSDRYLMVEAAVAVEAFTDTYDPSNDAAFPSDPALPFRRLLAAQGGARDAGYPTDATWAEAWSRNEQVCEDDPTRLDEPRNPQLDDICLSLQSWWAQKLAALALPPDPLPMYSQRWTKYANSAPWRGLFASNLDRVQLWNFFNRNDQALEITDRLAQSSPWLTAQIVMKPYMGISGLGPDTSGLSWSLLEHSLLPIDFEALWGDTVTAVEANLTRSWAELFFQLQPLSGPAGAQEMTFLGSNRDMTVIGGAGGSMDYPSHTYWTNPYQSVVAFFSQIKELLERP